MALPYVPEPVATEEAPARRSSPGTPMIDRIERNSERSVETGCWTWRRYVTPEGYGRIVVGRKSTLAHRVSYEAHVGLIPAGMQLDHLCRNRACVNPAHLEPVTSQENSIRGLRARPPQTHCCHGHPFDEENTYRTRLGRRSCKACRRRAVNAHYAANGPRSKRAPAQARVSS
jgi:hypothetical protein